MKIYTKFPISRITERGQVTLPKQMRTSPIMHGVRAVEFIGDPQGFIIRPVRSVPNVTRADEQTELFIASMGDWLDPVNDDLFDFSKTV